MEKPLFIVFWVMSVFAVVLSYTTYHIFNASGYTTSSHIFSKTEDVYNMFNVDIILSSWSNTSWDFAYVWQIVWIVYALTLIIRKSTNGRLYYAPPFFIQWMFLPYITAACTNIIWNILFSLRLISYSLVFILLTSILLGVSLGIVIYGARKYGQDLVDEGKKKELVFDVLFAQYGLGFYLNWTLFTALINFSMVLHYRANVEMETASTIMLVVFGVMATVWFILDNFVFEKAVRYFAVMYYVSIYGLISMTARNYKSGSRNSIISIVLIVMIVIFFVVKIIYSSVRSKKHPIFAQQKVEPEGAINTGAEKELHEIP